MATGMAAKNMPTQAWAWRPAGGETASGGPTPRQRRTGRRNCLRPPIPNPCRPSFAVVRFFSSAGGFSAGGLLAGFRAGGETGPYFFADNSVR